jgi:hypothetical protein
MNERTNCAHQLIQPEPPSTTIGFASLVVVVDVDVDVVDVDDDDDDATAAAVVVVVVDAVDDGA